jgi:hypothetical protein
MVDRVQSVRFGLSAVPLTVAVSDAEVATDRQTPLSTVDVLNCEIPPPTDRPGSASPPRPARSWLLDGANFVATGR